MKNVHRSKFCENMNMMRRKNLVILLKTPRVRFEAAKVYEKSIGNADFPVFTGRPNFPKSVITFYHNEIGIAKWSTSV